MDYQHTDGEFTNEDILGGRRETDLLLLLLVSSNKPEWGRAEGTLQDFLDRCRPVRFTREGIIRE